MKREGWKRRETGRRLPTLVHAYSCTNAQVHIHSCIQTHFLLFSLFLSFSPNLIHLFLFFPLSLILSFLPFPFLFLIPKFTSLGLFSPFLSPSLSLFSSFLPLMSILTSRLHLSSDLSLPLQHLHAYTCRRYLL